MSLLIVDLDATLEAETQMTRVIWVSKCWSSKFRIKLLVHFWDTLPKPFFSLFLMLSLLSAMYQDLWVISILQQSGYLWLGELEVTVSSG